MNHTRVKDAWEHWEKNMLKELKTLIELWEKSGRIAFHRPRKKTVSLNGFKEIPEKDALEYLREWASKKEDSNGHS
jgi:hypothetical protein